LLVATPEAVSLSLDVAGLGQRALAWLVDAALLFVAWFTLMFGVSYLRQFDFVQIAGLDGWIQALLVLAVFGLNWGYGLVFEALWRGQTPGKRLLGLRVVRTDGSPATFVDLAVRNLCRFIDFLPLFYVAGVISIAATSQSRRLGDLVAGTLVIREHVVDLDRYGTGKPQTLSGLPPLPPEQIELVLEFVQRARELDPLPRRALALKLAGKFASRLPEAERAKLSDPALAEGFLQALGQGEA
jgi:uncharacterized RDD family membrane protein YckC